MKAQPNDVIVGAAAGVVATVPMTIVMEELHRALPGEHDGPLPPREVTEGMYARLGGEVESTREESLEQATVVAHYAFGGIAGALFPLVAPRSLPAALGAGCTASVCGPEAIWECSPRLAYDITRATTQWLAAA